MRNPKFYQADMLWPQQLDWRHELERIAVIGCSGSGKSTLARELASRMDVSVTHLDQLYWQPGWNPPTDLTAFRNAMDKIVSGSRWVLDGEFLNAAGHERFKRASLVVLFDLPMPLCLYRAIKRAWAYRGEARPDLATGCPEKFDLEFYRYIWRYRKQQLPKVEALIAEHFKGKLVRIRNESDRAAFLAEFPRSAV